MRYVRHLHHTKHRRRSFSSEVFVFLSSLMRNYSALISTTFWLPILLIYFQKGLWKCLYFIADDCYFYDIDLPISLIHFPFENMNIDLFQYATTDSTTQGLCTLRDICRGRVAVRFVPFRYSHSYQAFELTYHWVNA